MNVLNRGAGGMTPMNQCSLKHLMSPQRKSTLPEQIVESNPPSKEATGVDSARPRQVNPRQTAWQNNTEKTRRRLTAARRGLAG